MLGKRRRCTRWLVALVVGFASGHADAVAQVRAAGPKPVLIQGGTILTVSRRGTIKGGTLLLRKGKIGAIRAGTRGGMPNPMLIRIDAKGKFVTPGLIDARTNLASTPGGPSKQGHAAGHAADTINPYARHLFVEALHHGVTGICIEPPGQRGFVGTTAFIRQADLDHPVPSSQPSSSKQEKPSRRDQLTARLGMGTVGPFVRLSQLKTLRSALEEAREYREAWEDYREDLETYVKDLKAGKTVELKEEKKPKKPAPKDKQASRRPGKRRGRRRPRPRESSTEAWLRSLAAQATLAAQAPNDSGASRADLFDAEAADAPDRDDLAGKEETSSKKKDEEKGKEHIKKPRPPETDADKEVLVRTLKRELPVRFEAHRPADILNVLALIKEFNLDASIVGASGAGYVAHALAEADVPVILDPLVPSGLFDNSHRRDLRDDNAALLAEAGVRFAIAGGRGGEGWQTAYLAQKAASAVGHGLDREAALRAITIDAAKLCGVAETLGSLEVGKQADVVIWSGPPLAADSVVEYVFAGGKEVYRRGK